MDDIENETIVLLNEGRMTELEMERAFALNALKHNPGMLDNPITFEKLCFVLNDIKPNMETFEPPSLLVIAKAIKELGIERQWNSEIKYFIAFIAAEEGWTRLPEVISFAQEALDDIQEEVELDEEQMQIQELKHKAAKMYLDLL